MSRRRRATHRVVTPDARYNSGLVTHLINVIMKSGKKTIAERVVYGAFEKVSEKLQKGDPVDLLMTANPDATPEDVVKLRSIDGVDQPLTMDYRTDRYDVAVDKGVISSVISNG